MRDAQRYCAASNAATLSRYCRLPPPPRLWQFACGGALMPELLNGAEDADAIERDTAHASVESEASNEALVKDLAKKAHDLDAVRKSVDDAASISGTLWFSYLFTLLYIAIAAGAVTHKDLLLENPVKLPFLNVELPLVAFFALAPILFIIAHAYTLMHFVMLAAKVGTYDTELRKKPFGTEARETRLGLRRQLPSNIFVQFLAGPSDIREGGLGWLLKSRARSRSIRASRSVPDDDAARRRVLPRLA
jgi:hypothetical protein